MFWSSPEREENPFQCLSTEVQGGRRGWVMTTQVSGTVSFPGAQSLRNTAPRICPPQGTCSEQVTDVRCNRQTPPRPSRTQVTHRARLAGSRCSLGLWNEAKALTGSEWPWPALAVLQRHSTPILRLGCGCRVGSQRRCWKRRTTKAVKSGGVSIQLKATHPFGGLISQMEKYYCYYTTSWSVCFSILQQVKWRKKNRRSLSTEIKATLQGQWGHIQRAAHSMVDRTIFRHEHMSHYPQGKKMSLWSAQVPVGVGTQSGRRDWRKYGQENRNRGQLQVFSRHK